MLYRILKISDLRRGTRLPRAGRQEHAREGEQDHRRQDQDQSGRDQALKWAQFAQRRERRLCHPVQSFNEHPGDDHEEEQAPVQQVRDQTYIKDTAGVSFSFFSITPIE